jgi:hypothetical protein
MRNSTLLPIVVALLTAAGTPHAVAQMDVDQADSLNFEAFHKDKKEAVKVWKDDATKKAETVKTYEQAAPAAPAANQPAALTSAPVAVSTATVPTAAPVAASKPGQRFEIRERYALGRSAGTPYSAFYVIEAMHQQSAKLCPKGWKKLTERSEPVEGDFYLYYEIECL